ncbi:porin family protein [bacterium]|nr:porin family protein [bacterium]
MKKLVSLSILAAVAAMPAMAAPRNATPSHIAKDGKGGYDVMYNYKDKSKTGWYLTGRAELSFLNFKNKYSSADEFDADESHNEDKYSFEPVFGGSLAAGKKINHFWRAELEGGYLGYFEDEDEVAKFSISMPYMMINGYYDFTNGLYLGAGVGATLAQYKISGDYFNGYSKDKTSFSPMAGVMFGWTHALDENLVVDLRYRLAGMTGSEMKLHFQDTDDNTYWFKSKTGMILDNSLSLGIRYEF